MRKITKWTGLFIIAAMILAAVPAYAQDAAALVEDIPTIQAFTTDTVAHEDLIKIANAGVNAPSGMNSQPWHFSVVTDSSVIEKIAGGGDSGGDSAESEGGESAEDAAAEGESEGGESEGSEGGEAAGPPTGDGPRADVGDVPCLIIISCTDGADFDAGLACQNMSVEAALLGYGTKIVSSPAMTLNGTEFREILGIPENMSVVAVLMIGVSAQDEADIISSATPRNDDLITFVGE